MIQPGSSMGFSTRRVLIAAMALRMALIILGVGEYLAYRVEVSTPANSLLSYREGLALLRMGIFPFSGSSCHVPPLLLWPLAPCARNLDIPVAWPGLANLLIDALAGLVLLRTVTLLQRACQRLHSGSASPGAVSQWVHPSTAAALYWLNPFTLASCVSGTTSSLENMVVLAAIWRASAGDQPGAAFAVALATYISPHAITLLVPIALLVAIGPEDCFGQPQQLQPLEAAACGAAQGAGVTGSPGDKAPEGSSESGAGVGGKEKAFAAGGKVLEGGGAAPGSDRGHGGRPAGLPWRSLRKSTGFFCCWLLLLVLMSELLVRRFPDHLCLLNEALPAGSSAAQQGRSAEEVGMRSTLSTLTNSSSSIGDMGCGADPSDTFGASGAGSVLPKTLAEALERRRGCWALHVYRLHLLMEDLTPNIGQMWYFFTEVFSDFRPFFRFVMHALCGLFVLPLALRFPRRPVLLITAQCLIVCLFKPYPSVADHALYMALLPLLQKQLSLTRCGMLLTNSFLLLAVLEPAMWHQWINIESANSNFYYSITLLLGAWQVLLLVILLQLAVQVERVEKGKPSQTPS